MTMYAFVVAAIAVFLGAIRLIAKSFLTSFSSETAKVVVALENAEELASLTEKGKNIATKKDIQEITRLQEAAKVDFQTRMELQKAELNRISKEFELYVVKKHEYYPELYKHIAICTSKIKGLRGLRTVIDFRQLSEDEIAKFMEDKSFNESDKHLILSNLNTNKEAAIKNLELVLLRLEYNEAKNTYIEANNFYLLHRLYFSNEISSITKELLSDTYKLWANYDPDFMTLHTPKVHEQLLHDIKVLKENIDKLHDRLFEKMQEELIAK
ncbi:hypothetical protein [Bacillus cereus]|uniref:hypothetical protein n=1 Tax=Bacillus cereus TaxID=1396 RepID=UPI0018CFF7F4|nr:hypothetical protein [Bacillus cereus]MBH0323396.1 hypothetical protein [Bacillus cereus]